MKPPLRPDLSVYLEHIRVIRYRLSEIGICPPLHRTLLSHLIRMLLVEFGIVALWWQLAEVHVIENTSAGDRVCPHLPDSQGSKPVIVGGWCFKSWMDCITTIEARTRIMTPAIHHIVRWPKRYQGLFSFQKAIESLSNDSSLKEFKSRSPGESGISTSVLPIIRRYAEGFGGGERIGLERSVTWIMTDSLEKRKKISLCNLVVICYYLEMIKALEEVIVTE